MGTILEVIQQVRERPGVMLGRPCVNNLYYFLLGVTHVQGDHDFLAGFNQWVHDRYEITSSQGWAKIIEFYSVNEAGEMALFWKLFDEYLAQRKAGLKKLS